MDPIEYIKKNWGDYGARLTFEELKVESGIMLLLRKTCSTLAIEDLANYTQRMASILNVKRTISGCEQPVLDRKGWINSIIEDPSNLQLEKWIFAFLFARSNYKKFVSQLKHPDETFEENFMRNH